LTRRTGLQDILFAASLTSPFNQAMLIRGSFPELAILRGGSTQHRVLLRIAFG
jgi:hypothetical protein